MHAGFVGECQSHDAGDVFVLEAVCYTPGFGASKQDRLDLKLLADIESTSNFITAISFPVPKRAAYMKFKQAASRFALVGVFVAQTDAGVRVAVTGAGSGVVRHKGLEDALNKSFTPEAAAAVKIDSSGLNSDIHASAAYRATLIGVQTQRAVAKALG